MLRHVLFGLTYRVLAVMKNTCCQHRVGMAVHNPINQMLQITYTPACDHRYIHCVRYRMDQRQIKSVAGPVSIHAREQYFPCPKCLHLLCPLDHI
jgi:hypothetical protein